MWRVLILCAVLGWLATTRWTLGGLTESELPRFADFKPPQETTELPVANAGFEQDGGWVTYEMAAPD